MHDRIEALNRQVQALEGKAQSLQVTIDRLTCALQKTEEEESQQKDKVQNLNMTLSDNQSIINELQDRVSQLQKGLTSSEHDRRVLQERLDSTRYDLNKRINCFDFQVQRRGVRCKFKVTIGRFGIDCVIMMEIKPLRGIL